MKRVQVSRRIEPGDFKAVRLDCQQLANDENCDVELWCGSDRVEVFRPSEWRHAT